MAHGPWGISTLLRHHVRSCYILLSQVVYLLVSPSLLWQPCHQLLFAVEARRGGTTKAVLLSSHSDGKLRMFQKVILALFVALWRFLDASDSSAVISTLNTPSSFTLSFLFRTP